MGDGPGTIPLRLEGCEAVICDTDGVITDTAVVHAAAWQTLFDDYLRRRADRDGDRFVPFDIGADYRRFVDGRARYDGAAAFLESRGLSLPFGAPTDLPGRETVCGLANRKDELFVSEITAHPVRAYPGSLRFFDAVLAARVPLIAVSASRNARQVLRSAGVIDRFAFVVDGLDAERLGLAGKPDPALFLEAARHAAASPARSVIAEDAIAGVAAGRRGGFGTVIGVDRTGHPAALRESGAHVVVRDLGELDLVVKKVVTDPGTR